MRRLLLTIAIAAGLAGPVVAQRQDSLLADAIRLATEGQGDSARALVNAHLRALSPSDSQYPEVLYAAGVVAADTDSALTHFRRLTIEYSRSEWADDALLRMSQLAFAAGDLRAAIRAADRILLDYPFSDISADAAHWSGRAHVELGELAEGCPLLRRAHEAAVDNFELANRTQYFLRRCVGAEAATDSARPPAAQPGAAPPGRSGTVYTVQVAAVQSASAADDLMQRISAHGYEPHVVRDTDGLLKVRVGRFTDRAEAQRLVGELRRLLGGTPFVVEEQ